MVKTQRDLMKRLAALVLAMVIVLLPSAARAEYTGPAPGPITFDPLPPFNEAPCMSVYLNEVEPEYGSHIMVLNGAAVQCAPIVEYGGFRVATYLPDEPTGTAPSWNARRFHTAEEGSIRSFGAAALPWRAGEYAVCVLGVGLERLACGLAVLTSTQNGGFRTILTSLPTDSPLVDKEVSAGPYTGRFSPPRGGGTGHCATCF